MHRTQIYLTTDERKELLSISIETGQHQSALIREAIDQFIENKRNKKRSKNSALKAAAGLWKTRKDLPHFGDLRKEFDRQELDE